MSLLRRFAALMLLLAPLAHAAPLPKLKAALAEDAKARLIVVQLEQSEVAVDDADVGSAGGGLLGALIEITTESTKTKNRQAAIVPLRDALLSFSFEEELSAALRRHLPTSMVAADAKVIVVRTEREYRDLLRRVTPATMLFLNARYSFEEDFQMAYVHAFVQLQRAEQALPDEAAWEALPNRKRRKLAPAVLHTGNYYSAHVTHSPYGRQQREKGDARYEHNAKRWAAAGADAMRAAFVQGADEVAATLRLEAERALPAAGEKRRVIVPSAWSMPALRKLPHLEAQEGRTLLQDKYELFWVDDRLIKS